ncbi:MAG: phosphotransferase [Bacteroidaceae bacterium]|nr:phosphotransferase [Bacteroidaceae bacterium]
MVGSLRNLFVECFGTEPALVVKLCGDGSNRAYYRLAAGELSAIGVVGVSVEENRAFIAIAKAFAECGIAAPRVLAVSGDSLSYLQNDLGDETLFASMKSSRESGSFSQKDVDMLCKVMSALPHIQYKVPACFDFSISYPYGEFDKRSVMWDLNYFKYCFLKGVGVEFNERMLEDEFERMAAMLLRENENTFLYRDFQSRNVMLHDGEPFFIDFQGARKGPIYYDVASFVGQARACYTPDVEEKMIDAYLASLSEYRSVERDEFMGKLQLFRLFRLLQNLGAYGYRGLFERKKAFVEIIPAALAQLNELLGLPAVDFPYLRALVGEMSSLPLFRREEIKELTVDVVSFSYRRGIPDDTSGNGGGFVFDCRAIHNPGRYEAYKKLNGMDKPVIDFLEKESDIASFLENAYSMVDNMVETYLKRGFTHIQVCCGCTGGQHRSVYSAEHIARHVADKFGVKVVVTHKMLNKKYVV